jgi:glycosyltransferase involved in cell wall biosynthesis
MAAAVARKAGFATVVATCHGWNPQRQDAFNLQDSLAFGLTDAITSPSACWAAALEREMGIENVTVVPVGLDLRRYPSTEARHSERAATSIATLAELTARKGIGDLLEAMPTVWRHAPAVQLHLFGDGDAREGLEARAAELDPSRTRIFFHGFVTEPYRRLRDFDLFCFPSRSDNFPVALMEAMLARLPVVATDVGGIPELVAQSGCGHVVPPEAPAALAAEIVALLGLPAERRCELGARGERFVRQHCGIETTVNQLDAVYAAARGGASVPGRRPWTPRPCA